MCLYVCKKGSPSPLNRFGSPIQYSFSQVLEKCITILGRVHNLPEKNPTPQKIIFYSFFLKLKLEIGSRVKSISPKLPPHPPNFIFVIFAAVFMAAPKNGYTIYVNIMTEEILSSFQVANVDITYWSLRCSPSRRGGDGVKRVGRIVILASYRFHFIRVQDNLV